MVDLELAGSSKYDAIRTLAQLMCEEGRVVDVEAFLRDAAAREDLLATGLPGGIAIPHCRSAAVTAPSVAVGVSSQGIDFGADDGPAHLVLLIAAPDGQDDEHLRVLAGLSRKLVHSSFVNELKESTSPETVARTINEAVSPS